MIKTSCRATAWGVIPAPGEVRGLFPAYKASPFAMRRVQNVIHPTYWPIERPWRAELCDAQIFRTAGPRSQSSGHRTATGLTGAPTAPVILSGAAVRKKS